MTADRPLGRTFRAVVETVVPEASRLDAAAWREVGSVIETALRQRTAHQRRQLALFLRVLSVLAIARGGRGFAALPPARRHALLARLAASRLLLLRRGAWGVKTLALMGYYGRAAAAVEIGYRASPRGWEARASASDAR